MKYFSIILRSRQTQGMILDLFQVKAVENVWNGNWTRWDKEITFPATILV